MCRDFINEHRSTIEELYYKRAVETGEFAFTFSIPFRNGYSSFVYALALESKRFV